MKVCVTDFGAMPNNKYEIQTKFFQDSIDYCFNNGGGEVVVPEGEYVIGDIRLRSNITLHLLKNAKILGREKGFMIYIKEAEKISDFIKILGANKAVMYFEDVRIYREQKIKLID